MLLNNHYIIIVLYNSLYYNYIFTLKILFSIILNQIYTYIFDIFFHFDQYIFDHEVAVSIPGIFII